MSESRLMLITFGLIYLKLKRRYSVVLGLADNLLATNQEKTSLMQDSIDMANDACSGKMNIRSSIIHIKMTNNARVFRDNKTELGGEERVEQRP